MAMVEQPVAGGYRWVGDVPPGGGVMLSVTGMSRAEAVLLAEAVDRALAARSEVTEPDDGAPCTVCHR